MQYGKVIHGQLVKKINRFIAEVNVTGELEQAHIKNTGRLKELLLPGAELLLEVSNNPNRKTKFSIVAVYKDNHWVNIDSQAPNVVAYEAIKQARLSEFGEVDVLKREVTYGDSRLDLYYESEGEKGFIEVKGVTLQKDGVALFPDAPTSRGTKHVHELIQALHEGYACKILFVVQMKGCHTFSPFREMDEAFTNALILASQQGVQIWAYDSIVKEDQLVLDEPLPILF